MNFEQLVTTLKSNFDIDYHFYDGSVWVSRSLLLNSCASYFLSDVIYIAQEDKLYNMCSFPENLLVLYTSDNAKNKCRLFLEGKNVNYIFSHADSYVDVINFVQELLISTQSSDHRYTYFLRMIVSGNDLNYILNEAAKQCGKQLIVLDFSGKIISYSKTKAFIDEKWSRHIRDGYCDAESMQHFNELLLQRTEISTKPYLYKCKETGTIYLSSPIMYNCYPYGYVFLISETREMDSKAYDIVPIMSKVAADFISRTGAKINSTAKLYQSIINDILLGESGDSINSRLTSGKIQAPERMRLLLVKPIFYQNRVESISALISQLTIAFAPVPPIEFENSIVLIQNLETDNTEEIEKTLDFIKKLAATNHLLVGISNVFYNLKDLAQFYCQADEALKLADRLRIQKGIVKYSDMAFYSLLSKLSVGDNMKGFCHPALATLKEFDNKNGTSLFDTLRVYVETGCNQKLTSELLFTHRNTIAYRKQQIIDITRINFQDSDELFQLTFSLKIYRFLEP